MREGAIGEETRDEEEPGVGPIRLSDWLSRNVHGSLKYTIGEPGDREGTDVHHMKEERGRTCTT